MKCTLPLSGPFSPMFQVESWPAASNLKLCLKHLASSAADASRYRSDTILATVEFLKAYFGGGINTYYFRNESMGGPDFSVSYHPDLGYSIDIVRLYVCDVGWTVLSVEYG
jgi:hypothetical protein